MITRVILAFAATLGFGVVLGAAAPAKQVAAGPAGRGGNVVRIEHRDPSTAPTRGPSTALVTIELFFDPKTNMQARTPSYRALERLQAKHPARIRLIYRVVKRGAQQQISIAALEAHAQGKFHELITELHLDKTSTMLTKDKILDLARRAGLDVSRLANAISEGRYEDVFEANNSRLERLARGGTAPNVLFNAKVPRASLGAPSDSDLEREYKQAYERAEELIDRGVPAARLMQAFELQALRSEQPFVVSSSSEDFEGSDIDHRLAKPPLDVAGLPSFGMRDASAIPVLVLCRPNDAGCFGTMRLIQQVQKAYAHGVRILWAPWFDVSREDAADLALLGDATLCAEQLGSSHDDPAASPGWRWITKQLEVITRQHGRRERPEKLIDIVSADLEIDSRQLSACRARMANSTLNWVAKARKSGVTRSPALVIGGRIYEGLNDKNLIQQLIEAELAPGVLARCATIGCTGE
jgi:predicted DsbA family dithiol-disulfide isomerase